VQLFMYIFMYMYISIYIYKSIYKYIYNINIYIIYIYIYMSLFDHACAIRLDRRAEHVRVFQVPGNVLVYKKYR